MGSTSQRAFESTRPYAPNKRERIYLFIASKGATGATADEFYHATGQQHTGNGTLFCDLHKAGFIEQNPVEKERMTRTERMATVYIVTNKQVTEGCFANAYYAHLHPPKDGDKIRRAALRVIEAFDATDRAVFKEAIEQLREVVARK